MFSPARPSSSVCLSVSVWFLIFIITTLIIHHSFTLSLQAQHLPFQQILLTLTLLLLWTAFTITGFIIVPGLPSRMQSVP